MMKQTMALGLGALLFCAAAAEAQEKITWRMTTYVPENSALYTHMTLPLVKWVGLMTDGAVEIQPFPAGVIVPGGNCFDAVVDGLADACQAPTSILFGKNPANAPLGQIPGGMGPDALFQWINGGGGAEILAGHHRESFGLHTLVAGIGGTEIFAHSHKPIRTPEDLVGLRIRTSGAAGTLMAEYFKGAPVTVPGDELYSMMERKAIDAAEWAGPADNVIKGLHETAKYIIFPGVHGKSYIQGFSVKKEAWDALSDELKVKIEAAARLATLDSMIGLDRVDIEAWKKLKAGGNEFVEVDPSLVEAYRKAGREWATKIAAEQTAKGDPWMEKAATSYYAFYDDWINNAEFRAVD